MKAESEDCNVLFTYLKLHSADAVAARLGASAILEWHETGRYSLARQWLEKAVLEDPRSSDGYYRLGVLDQEEGKWNESVVALKRATDLRPTWSKAHLRLAQAYARIDQKQDAHREALLARQFREDEDLEMQAKREELKTFILDNASVAQNSAAH